MAFTKKSRGKGTGKKRRVSSRKAGRTSLILLFWLCFFIFIICLFLFNRDLIRRTIQETGITDRFEAPTGDKPVGDGKKTGDASPSPGESPAKSAPSVSMEDSKPKPEKSLDAKKEAESPGESAPSGLEKPMLETPATEEKGSEKPAPEKPPEAARQPPPPEKTAAQRERTLYFMVVDKDGTIVRTKTTRSLPLSDTPMLDALNALLQGPTEGGSGLLSLIPEGTRILSASVRGSTAYINFNENIQFNTFGVEGYAASLQQIVWTATEFANVKDVQILIEGHRIDYLGEGIWIGSPIDRSSFNL